MIWLGLVFMGVAYDWLTTLWLIRWLTPPGDRADRVPGEALRSVPVTFFRPLKVGVPQIGLKLRSFFSAMQPQDQVIIGVYDDDFITLNEARAAAAEFPDLDLQIVPCRRDLARNPKISKLIQLVPFARWEHWMVLDSEIVNAGPFLTEFRIEWNSAQFPVFSAPYRFCQLTLTTAPVLHTLLPGLAVLIRLGKIQNTLGAAVAVTRSQIEKLGGWSELGNELAEDYELGHRLARCSVPVQLSRAVAVLENDPSSPGSIYRQLHRISATYRLCQPWGFASSVVLHSVTWSLFVCHYYSFSWIILVLACASRIMVCRLRAQQLGWQIPLARLIGFVPVSSLAETFIWLCVWLPIPIYWSGKKWPAYRKIFPATN